MCHRSENDAGGENYCQTAVKGIKARKEFTAICNGRIHRPHATQEH